MGVLPRLQHITVQPMSVDIGYRIAIALSKLNNKYLQFTIINYIIKIIYRCIKNCIYLIYK